MNQSEKKEIVKKLEAFVSNKGSQNKAAASLKVSGAVISHLINGNWEPYSDEMFRKIGNQVGYNSNVWQIAETTNTLDLLELFAEAKINHSRYTIIAPAGSGKTQAAELFAASNKNSFHIKCGQYWDQKFFLQEILKNLGVKYPSNRISEMMQDIVKEVRQMESPSMIIDEIDKLDEKGFLFLITFYNELFSNCSLIIMATPYLKKRIDDGVRLQKKGYAEIKSRFGRYYVLEDTSKKDIEKICVLNGVTDAKMISDFSKSANGDLRVVRDLVDAYKVDDKRANLTS